MPREVSCEQSYTGGGWTRVMSAKYPHFFNHGIGEALNVDALAGDD